MEGLPFLPGNTFYDPSVSRRCKDALFTRPVS